MHGAGPGIERTCGHWNGRAAVEHYLKSALEAFAVKIRMGESGIEA